MKKFDFCSMVFKENGMRMFAILAFTVLFSLCTMNSQSFAANWQGYLTCRTNQGQFWLDRATDGPWNQIVIRDEELIRYLVSREAIDKGDLDYDHHQLVLGTYGGESAGLNFTGDATYRAGKPGIYITQKDNSIRFFSTFNQGWKCYCDGYVNGDLECIGTTRCPDPIVLFDFVVTDCRTN